MRASRIKSGFLPRLVRDGGLWSLLAALAVFLSGCAAPRATGPAVTAPRPFQFERDTFAFANELVWEYFYDQEGNWTTQKQSPKPSWSHRCFPMTLAARQFFNGARFEASLPPTNGPAYRRLVRQVLKTNPRHPPPDAARVVIPGYASLREFSAAHAPLVQEACGGAWRSYVQRGHWRMVFPFSRSHQEQTALSLLSRLSNEGPRIVHVLRFPKLTINHALLIYAARETPERIEFLAYDPNQPDAPAPLTYDRACRRFHFPPNRYFPGGRVDVYEVYHRWNY
ncbi:MAG TPA: hypothetical protein P5038_14420 [Candidatus Paceibacterota bacterium]|nr:hypothetical protein [Candidatus Paceibacterota bacterium]